jgi:hypothetical protein
MGVVEIVFIVMALVSIPVAWYLYRHMPIYTYPWEEKEDDS